jgi:hypothetical protein
MKNLLIVLFVVIVFFSCTENQKVRAWGGTGNYDLPKGEQLMNVTWKAEGELWILTKIRPDSVKPQAYKFFSKKDGLFQSDGIFFIREQ